MLTGISHVIHRLGRSLKLFTHATPTLFNAATPRPQLSSCFLLTIKEDSIEGIYDTLKQCASISKFAGGREWPNLLFGKVALDKHDDDYHHHRLIMIQGLAFRSIM